MTANPLRKRLAETDQPKLTLQQQVDRANDHLAQIGRAHELEWVILNGSTHIQHRRKTAD